MSEEHDYNFKLALFTAVVLILGSVFVFAINSSSSVNPQWGNFGAVVIPSLLFISFAPLGIEKLINKKESGK